MLDELPLRLVWTQYIRPYARWVVMLIILLQLTVGGLGRDGEPESGPSQPAARVAPEDLPLPRTARFDLNDNRGSISARYKGSMSLTEDGLGLKFTFGSEAYVHRQSRSRAFLDGVGLVLMEMGTQGRGILHEQVTETPYSQAAYPGDPIYYAAHMQLQLDGVEAADLASRLTHLLVAYDVRFERLGTGPDGRATYFPADSVTRVVTYLPKEALDELLTLKPWERD